VDYIVINGYGIIANYKYPELYLRPRAQGYKYYGYFYETWEDLTLAIFLLYINTSFAALPLMATTVLERYLRNIKPKQLQRHDYEGFWE
jgi:hypothetical protein